MQCSNLTSYKQIFEYKKTKFSKGLFLPYPRQRNWYTFQTKHKDIEKRRTVLKNGERWKFGTVVNLIRSCFFNLLYEIAHVLWASSFALALL